MGSTGHGIKLSTTGRLTRTVLTLAVLSVITWLELLIVCVCRYLRFFPDGRVMMLTTPDDPLVSVPRLRSRNTRFGLNLLWT